jgi:hypothetical protein
MERGSRRRAKALPEPAASALLVKRSGVDDRLHIAFATTTIRFDTICAARRSSSSVSTSRSWISRQCQLDHADRAFDQLASGSDDRFVMAC